MTCAMIGQSPDMRGPTGSPDESGQHRREEGLGKAGNTRMRRGMIQLAWRFLIHQKNSTLVERYRASIAAGKKPKTMVVRWLASCSSHSGVSSRLATCRKACSCAPQHDFTAEEIGITRSFGDRPAHATNRR